jgi:hypothetical protein
MNNTNRPRKCFSVGHRNGFQNQKGVTIVLVALLLVALLGFAALAIDIGYYMVARNELQNIADGAALAACRQLGVIYQAMAAADQQSYECPDEDLARIIATAVDVGRNNRAGGLEGVVIRPEDVVIGTWSPRDDPPFNPTTTQPDAVRVIARRDATENNPIGTFFARIVGIDTMAVQRDATAALTGQSTTDPGELELPVGISAYFFEDGHFCNDSIVFAPTNDPSSCAGWNSYNATPANDNTIRSILEGDIASPGTTADETVFNFIGGNLSNPTFDALLLAFMRKGYDVDESGNPIRTTLNAEGNPIPVTGHLGEEGVPLYHADGTRAYYPDSVKDPTPRNLHRWETTVVVYDRTDCSNPNTSLKVVGYSTVIITDVQDAPEKRIVGKVLCDQFSNFSTRGSGGEYGTKGTVSGLVQ